MKSRKTKLIAALGVVLATVVAIAGAVAYFTHEEVSSNRFTTGHNTITPVEEFTPPEELVQGQNAYKKDVAVFNEADSVPCYVRVAVEFSDEDIAKVSGFSPDGTNYFSAMPGGVTGIKTAGGETDTTGATTGIKPAAFVSNMGTNSKWVYISKSEDPKLGGYFYYTEVVQPNTKTDSLFKKVMTYFASSTDIRAYDIFIYAESVQSLSKEGYEFPGSAEAAPWKQAWQEFLDRSGE